MVEVDADRETRTGEADDARKAGREERKKNLARQQRRERANERRSGRKS